MGLSTVAISFMAACRCRALICFRLMPPRAATAVGKFDHRARCVPSSKACNTFRLCSAVSVARKASAACTTTSAESFCCASTNVGKQRTTAVARERSHLISPPSALRRSHWLDHDRWCGHARQNQHRRLRVRTRWPAALKCGTGSTYYSYQPRNSQPNSTQHQTRETPQESSEKES
jgi:hypothetical protein